VLAVVGDSAFGFSGMEVETICRYNLPVCVVVFNNNGIYRGTDVNAAGADLEGELGEAHTPETHLIPLAIQAALGVRSTLDILGTDYPTADGTAIRDYIHVADLAGAHLGALRFLLSGGVSTALNLGTGQGYSVRQVIEAVERVAERAVPAREMPRRAGDFDACWEAGGVDPAVLDPVLLDFSALRAAQKAKAALVPMHTMRGVSELAAVWQAVRAGDIGEPLMSFSQKTYKWGQARPDSVGDREVDDVVCRAQLVRAGYRGLCCPPRNQKTCVDNRLRLLLHEAHVLAKLCYAD